MSFPCTLWCVYRICLMVEHFYKTIMIGHKNLINIFKVNFYGVFLTYGLVAFSNLDIYVTQSSIPTFNPFTESRRLTFSQTPS